MEDTWSEWVADTWHKWFGEPTPKEKFQASKRQVMQSARSLERDKTLNQARQKSIENEIRGAARTKPDRSSIKPLALELVRARTEEKNINKMRSQLHALASRLDSARISVKSSAVMRELTSTLASLGDTIDPRSVQKTLMYFEKYSERLDNTTEMLEETTDIIGDEGADEQSDEIVDQIFEEMGVADLVNLPPSTRKWPPDPSGNGEITDDMIQRLAALKEL